MLIYFFQYDKSARGETSLLESGVDEIASESCHGKASLEKVQLGNEVAVVGIEPLSDLFDSVGCFKFVAETLSIRKSDLKVAKRVLRCVKNGGLNGLFGNLGRDDILSISTPKFFGERNFLLNFFAVGAFCGLL